MPVGQVHTKTPFIGDWLFAPKSGSPLQDLLVKYASLCAPEVTAALQTKLKGDSLPGSGSEKIIEVVGDVLVGVLKDQLSNLWSWAFPSSSDGLPESFVDDFESVLQPLISGELAKLLNSAFSSGWQVRKKAAPTEHGQRDFRAAEMDGNLAERKTSQAVRKLGQKPEVTD